MSRTSMGLMKQTNRCVSQRVDAPFPYFETSASEGINIEQAFQKVAELAQEYQSSQEVAYTPPTLSMNNSNRNNINDDQCANC